MFDSITVQTASESANIQTLIYTILLAFILASLLAMVYQKTIGNQVYSRNFIQSVVLISLISAIIIQAVGDSLARGLGIMATMGIIRFRTNLKDPKDLLFLFASVAVGISCGSYAFDIAIVGTVGFSLAVIILYFTPLGPDKEEKDEKKEQKKEQKGTLRFSLSTKTNEKKYLDRFMQHYCKEYFLSELNDAEDESIAYAYNISLKEDKNYEQLLKNLRRLPSIKNIKLKLSKVK